MTLAELISFASFGAAMDKYATNEEYSDIREFAKNCHDMDMIDTDLEDIRISRQDRAEPSLYGYSIENLAFIAAILQQEHISPTELKAILYDVERMSRIVIKDITDTARREIERQMKGPEL